MISKKEGNTLITRLPAGEKLFESLEKLAKQYRLQTASIVNGIGMMDNFEIGYFQGKGNYSRKTFSKPHELVSLQGTIALQADGTYITHLHASFGNEKHEIIGGHLFEGNVAITAELVLLISNIKLERKLEEETGLKGICRLG